MKEILHELKAFVFDLDGTVVDSKLDFDLMREDLGFPEKAPILEHLETIQDEEVIKKSMQIIHEHEMRGAEVSTPFEGVLELIELLKEKQYPIGLLTRNSKAVTDIVLKKFNLEFDMVFTRDDCKAKPDPEGLILMAQQWNIQPSQLIYIGDFLFDLETAKNANAYSGLFLNHKNQSFKDHADIIIENYTHFLRQVRGDFW